MRTSQQFTATSPDSKQTEIESVICFSYCNDSVHPSPAFRRIHYFQEVQVGTK